MLLLLLLLLITVVSGNQVGGGGGGERHVWHVSLFDWGGMLLIFGNGLSGLGPLVAAYKLAVIG